jgi:hypothetical protein
MDLTKKTTQEIEALIRLLTEMERQEEQLVNEERREAEERGQLH